MTGDLGPGRIPLSALFHQPSLNDDWDRKMAVEFSPSGRGMAMGERAERDIAAGDTMGMEDFIALVEQKRELGKSSSGKSFGWLLQISEGLGGAGGIAAEDGLGFGELSSANFAARFLAFVCGQCVGMNCYHDGMPKLSHSPVHYTIRGVPAELDRVLRQKATQQKQSLNRVVIDELNRALIGRPVRADFSDLVGKWTPDPAFDEVVASQRRIDPEKWK